MIIKISTRDLPRAEQQLTNLIAQIPIRKGISTKKIAQQLLLYALTIPPMAPRTTGKLRRSGRVEAVPEGHAVFYGGPGYEVDYAEYVHDDLRPRNYTLPGSGPKFVETHVLRMETEGITTVSADIQELINEVAR